MMLRSEASFYGMTSNFEQKSQKNINSSDYARNAPEVYLEVCTKFAPERGFLIVLIRVLCGCRDSLV